MGYGVGVHWVMLVDTGAPDTRSIHDEESDIIFWVENLHPRYFGGSRDLSCIFLGLKVCLIE